MKKLKLNWATGLTVATFLGGIALDLLNKKAEKNERNSMKAELKDEIMKEIMSKKD